MKKDDSIIVFSVGAVDGMCSATLRAQAFRTPFFAPLTRLTRRGLKTAHRAVFLRPVQVTYSLAKKRLAQ